MTRQRAVHMLNGERITKFFCLLRTLTSVLTWKFNARLGGRHFGSNSALYGAKRQSNAGVWGWTVLEFTGILTTLNVTTLPFSMPQLNRCQIGHLYQARFLIFCLQRLCAMIFIASSVPIEILDAIVFVISFHPFSGFSTAKLLIT